MAIDLVSSNALMPVMGIEQAIQRRQLLVQFTRQIMVDGTDFGKVPGVDKPTLLKPGAEKLVTFFGLTTRFQETSRVIDRDSSEPYIEFGYRCQLYHAERLIAEADGSCNSWESKYRYRKAERVCPECGKPAIFKSKQSPGFYCWTKRDGCGANFPANDERIVGQETGRVPNPDVFDQMNTIQKMAAKRAMVAAVLIAVNASEFFTQDVEDLGPIIDADYSSTDTAPRNSPAEGTPAGESSPRRGSGPSATNRGEMLTALDKRRKEFEDLKQHPAWVSWLKKHFDADSATRLSDEQVAEAIMALDNRGSFSEQGGSQEESETTDGQPAPGEAQPDPFEEPDDARARVELYLRGLKKPQNVADAREQLGEVFGKLGLEGAHVINWFGKRGLPTQPISTLTMGQCAQAFQLACEELRAKANSGEVAE